MKPLELRVLPLDRLRPAGYNPRRLARKARAKLKASLETFGLVEPLVWNERTGRVVGGHQRLDILRELGITEAPVSVVNLSEPEEQALNVVLNNLEAQGRYDPAKLAELLEKLEPLDLQASGFEKGMLNALRFEAVRDVEPLDENTGVEITLKTDPETYEALSSKLDALIREFDLESHVKL